MTYVSVSSEDETVFNKDHSDPIICKVTSKLNDKESIYLRRSDYSRLKEWSTIFKTILYCFIFKFRS